MHPCCCQWCYFVPFYGWVIFHFIYIYIYIYIYTHTHTHTYIYCCCLFFKLKYSGLPKWLSGKESACQAEGFDPLVGKIPWRRKWQLTPVSLPGKPHGWRSLAGYSPWGRKELDMIEWLNHHHHQSWITMLCSSLLYSKMTQLYTYTFFFIFFSIMVYNRILNIVPCVIQEDFIAYSYFGLICW